MEDGARNIEDSVYLREHKSYHSVLHPTPYIHQVRQQLLPPEGMNVIPVLTKRLEKAGAFQIISVSA